MRSNRGTLVGLTLAVASLASIGLQAEAGMSALLNNFVNFVKPKVGPNNRDPFEQLNERLIGQLASNDQAAPNLMLLKDQLQAYNKFAKTLNSTALVDQAKATWPRNLHLLSKNRPLVEAMQEFSMLEKLVDGNVCSFESGKLIELFRKINKQALESNRNPLASGRRIDKIFEQIARRFKGQCLAKFADEWWQFALASKGSKPAQLEAIDANLMQLTSRTSDLMCPSYLRNYSGFQSSVKSLECEIERFDRLGGYDSLRAEASKVHAVLEAIHSSKTKGEEERAGEGEILRQLEIGRAHV